MPQIQLLVSRIGGRALNLLARREATLFLIDSSDCLMPVRAKDIFCFVSMEWDLPNARVLPRRDLDTFCLVSSVCLYPKCIVISFHSLGFPFLGVTCGRGELEDPSYIG